MPAIDPPAFTIKLCEAPKCPLTVATALLTVVTLADVASVGSLTGVQTLGVPATST